MAKAEARRASAGGVSQGALPKKPKLQGKPVTLDTLANGEKLCDGFNKGQCPPRACKRSPPEAHKCNGKMPSRDAVACGGPHPSMGCTQCERA